MSKKEFNCFLKSGLVAKSDLTKSNYKDFFKLLELEQTDFIKNEEKFRSQEYRWPRDPLHCWSRKWEYPYAYYHIKKEKEERFLTSNMNVVDYGSGVTFFPFSIARIGCNVTCLDIDPICEKDLGKAIKILKQKPGNVSFSKIYNNAIQLNSNCTDIVYCISVLEHIKNFEKTICEIHRILKKSALFVLTIDIDLCGYKDISINRFYDMQFFLKEKFHIEYTEVTTHPMDILTETSTLTQIEKFKFKTKQITKKIFNKEFYDTYPNLTVWCGIFRKI